MKTVLNLLLAIAIVFLGYLCVNSIMTPINFNKAYESRQKVVIQKLIDIRKIQVEFKNQNGRYTASLDTLVDFAKNGKVPQVFKTGVLTDQQLADGLTEAKAIRIVKSGKQKDIEKYGLQDFRRDTTYVPVFSELFADRSVDFLDTLALIPYSKGQKFEVQSTMFKNYKTGIEVPLFQANAPFEAFLGDLNRQELSNLIDKAVKLDRFPGLQVGSIDEPNNNAGNWE